MDRPRVNPASLADKYHAPGERIVEYSFPNGVGGLISLRTLDDGRTLVHLYRHDSTVEISIGKAAT